MRSQSSFSAGLAQACAIVSGVAGVAAGGLRATFGAGFTCIDTCPSRTDYVSQFAAGTLHLMAPSIVLALLSVLIYLNYCLATGHPRAIAVPLLVLVGACVALVLFAQARLPYLPVTSDGRLAAPPLENWEGEWGIALMLVSAGWSALMAQQARVRPATEGGPSAAR